VQPTQNWVGPRRPGCGGDSGLTPRLGSDAIREIDSIRTRIRLIQSVLPVDSLGNLRTFRMIEGMNGETVQTIIS
jgi:hypothetical protein